jgi:hypothetical protein
MEAREALATAKALRENRATPPRRSARWGLNNDIERAFDDPAPNSATEGQAPQAVEHSKKKKGRRTQLELLMEQAESYLNRKDAPALETVKTKDIARKIFSERFPHGASLIETSGDGLLCGLRALCESVKAQEIYPTVSVDELQDFVESPDLQSFEAETKGHGRKNQENLYIDQLAGIIRLWGQQQKLDLQLGYMLADGKKFLVPTETSSATVVVWIYSSSTLAAGGHKMSHYQGLRPHIQNGQVRTDTDSNVKSEGEPPDPSLVMDDGNIEKTTRPGVSPLLSHSPEKKGKPAELSDTNMQNARQVELSDTDMLQEELPSPSKKRILDEETLPLPCSPKKKVKALRSNISKNSNNADIGSSWENAIIISDSNDDLSSEEKREIEIRKVLNRIPITKHDIDTLNKGQCLNDYVVEFCLYTLLHQRNHNLHSRVYLFNSGFYNNLVEKGVGSVRMWTAKVDILAYDYVVVPIVENFHWWLAIICSPGKLG